MTSNYCLLYDNSGETHRDSSVVQGSVYRGSKIDLCQRLEKRCFENVTHHFPMSLPGEINAKYKYDNADLSNYFLPLVVNS